MSRVESHGPLVACTQTERLRESPIQDHRVRGGTLCRIPAGSHPSHRPSQSGGALQRLLVTKGTVKKFLATYLGMRVSYVLNYGVKASNTPQNTETQMRKLKIIEHTSLDGVIQNTGEGDFPYGDWTAAYRSPAGRDAMLAEHGESFDLVLGRRTYDMWSGFWP